MLVFIYIQYTICYLFYSYISEGSQNISGGGSGQAISIDMDNDMPLDIVAPDGKLLRMLP